MRERLVVAVTFDPARGYCAAARDGTALTALSLGGLRRQLEAPHGGSDYVEIVLSLDKRARSERDARRRGGAGRAGDAGPRQ
jgi:hypothetical protein